MTAFSFIVYRTPFAEDETEGKVSGGETAQDRFQWRAIVPPEEGVQREPVPDGTAATGAGQRTGSERGTNQDLVPEQAGENQEVEWLQESARVAAYGAGAVQPHDGRDVRRRDGRPHDRHVILTM